MPSEFILIISCCKYLNIFFIFYFSKVMPDQFLKMNENKEPVEFYCPGCPRTDVSKFSCSCLKEQRKKKECESVFITACSR